MMCTICRGKGYLICMRDDGYEAVQACDACRLADPYDPVYDTDAVNFAELDGIAALHEYPCYVVGRVVVS